jgi:hypothetical protein
LAIIANDGAVDSSDRFIAKLLVETASLQTQTRVRAGKQAIRMDV